GGRRGTARFSLFSAKLIASVSVIRAGGSRRVFRSGLLRVILRRRCRQRELSEALFGELLRLVPPFGKTLFLLAKPLAQLVLELHELRHELRVELFAFLDELALGSLALALLPLLDARELCVPLLL